MTRRRLLTLTSVLLIVAVAVAGATGQIAAAFDINRFGIHRYAAYTLLALAAAHVVLAWPDLMAMVRHWAQIGRRRGTPPGVPPTARVPAGRRFALGAAMGFAAEFDRVGWKYKDRAYRYALIEAGHIGQNLYLVAEALGLSCCAIGAFFDDDVNALVGIDGVREAAVYMAVVGHSASAG